MHVHSSKPVINLADQESIVGNYIMQAQIGEGSFGTIHRCRSIVDNTQYVIKKIRMGIDGSGTRNTSL